MQPFQPMWTCLFLSESSVSDAMLLWSCYTISPFQKLILISESLMLTSCCCLFYVTDHWVHPGLCQETPGEYDVWTIKRHHVSSNMFSQLRYSGTFKAELFIECLNDELLPCRVLKKVTNYTIFPVVWLNEVGYFYFKKQSSAIIYG